MISVVRLTIILLLVSLNCFARDLPLLGKSRVTWYFFKVYDAKLYGNDKEKLLNQDLNLELVYLRDFAGDDIVKQSISELKHLGTSEVDIANWRVLLLKLFPDVKEGDSILAEYGPNRGIKFIFNHNRVLGEFTDQRFADSFISIWLSPKTSRPVMRKELFGIRDE